MKSQQTLFCIPYAGGTKQVFNQFLPHFSDWNVVTIELPGKGTRFHENQKEQLNEIVEDIYLQIKRENVENYCFWGHSMGALLSFLVTQRIVEDGLPRPKHLFLSGRAAPTKKVKLLKHKLPQEEFIQMLIKMGGIPKEFVDDRDILLFFEATIRADFKVIETFEYIQKDQIDVPITVMLGSNEEFSLEDAQEWSLQTSNECEALVFSGGHFFIFDHIEEIAALINRMTYEN